MKKLLGLFIFIFSLTGFSQEENRYDKSFSKADSVFDNEAVATVYAKAAREAAKETNAELAEEIAELTSVSPELLERITPRTNKGNQVLTNDPSLQALLSEFRDGATYYKIDYEPTLKELKKVSLVRADLNFLGGVVEINGGKEIWLNSILLQYPNLLRVVFYHEMGILYGLKKQKNSSKLDFMSDRWEIDPQYEYWAYNRAQYHTQEKAYFTEMQKNHPLQKKL